MEIEQLLKELIKRYPNYYSLGAAVNWLSSRMNERKAGTKHVGFDQIDERIELKKLFLQLMEKDFPIK